MGQTYGPNQVERQGGALCLWGRGETGVGETPARFLRKPAAQGRTAGAAQIRRSRLDAKGVMESLKLGLRIIKSAPLHLGLIHKKEGLYKIGRHSEKEELNRIQSDGYLGRSTWYLGRSSPECLGILR